MERRRDEGRRGGGAVRSSQDCDIAINSGICGDERRLIPMHDDICGVVNSCRSGGLVVWNGGGSLNVECRMSDIDVDVGCWRGTDDGG